MSDHPSTFQGTPTDGGKTAWDDRASLHAKGSGEGVLDGANALRRGSFAEIIRHLMTLPESDRAHYVIKKAGDREYSAAEAMALAARDDFPSA